jgi:hypothetical protein
MTALLLPLRRWLAAAALLCAAAAPAPALADPVSYFVPYTGPGNVAVFDASAGTGGWVGSIDQFPDPSVPTPLALVSVVLFTVDAATQTFTGTFDFTTTDLVSSLFGTLSGTVSTADILTAGGQFSIDYAILGGTGLFDGAQGFGLSFLDFNPVAAGIDNYLESGLLVFAVPEPATLALVAMALLWVMTLSRRPARVRRVN